jgi:hypothetical protein
MRRRGANSVADSDKSIGHEHSMHDCTDCNSIKNRMRVVRGIRGIERNTVSRVCEPTVTSCRRPVELRPGERYVIAGEINEGLFEGDWKGYQPAKRQ